MDSRWIPTITSIITSGNVNGLTATALNPIVTGTHNVDISKSISSSYIQIFGNLGACGTSARLDSTGVWSARLGGRQGNSGGLTARIMYNAPSGANPKNRHKYPINGNECIINYNYISFGDISGPPNFNYLITQVANYGSRLQQANNVLNAKGISQQKFDIFWSMSNATSLICEMSNPNETIILVDNVKGWGRITSLPYGMGGFRETNTVLCKQGFTITPNNNSVSIPWEIWVAPYRNKPAIQVQRNRNLYLAIRPIILRASGPMGTVEKTLSYTSVIRKNIPW